MRLMGLDYGSKTVGVAISDPFGWTAQPIETITRKDEDNLVATIERLGELIKANEVGKVVLGLPKNMNNTEGERAELTRKFERRLLREFEVEVIMWDERLSTMGASRILDEAGGVRKKNQKKVIDKMAAVLILQSYLDSHPTKL